MPADQHYPQPTREQQAAALQLLRCRPWLALWPADLDAALTDPWRARLINLNAWVLAMRQTRKAGPSCPARTAPNTTGVLRVAAVDLKRAAAGDTD
jgi:hypothetical protein